MLVGLSDFADELDSFVSHHLALLVILDLFGVKFNACNFFEAHSLLLLLGRAISSICKWKFGFGKSVLFVLLEIVSRIIE